MRDTSGPGAPAAATPQTLTFFFCDLRDYTRFVETNGDAAATALIADYRRLVRAEVERTGGGEIKTEGDGFYVVFGSAGRAIQCAVGILRAAERHTATWPDRPIGLGIGLHAGEPVAHEGQYVGSAVNVAARLAAAAGPGELLVSEVVRALLRTSGAPAMTERTGLALKGVDDPPRVYAVEWRAREAAAAPKVAAARSGTGGANEVAIAADEPVDRRILSPAVIGREAELARLESILAEATSGRGRTVLVSGEAGLGKSAFLRAFGERAGASARFLAGECTEVEARRPFGPFVEILRAAFRDLSARSTRDGERAAVAEVLELFPEGARGEGPAAPAMEEEERYRAHAAFARLFGELAEATPLVVSVEDLHWADEATLELFPYLARKLREHRVLLVATYRSDELHRTHPLRRVLADLVRARLVDEIALHRLTVEEVAGVLRAALRLAQQPTAEFTKLIHDRCEGNPLFIEEVLRALVERGDIAYRDGSWRRTKDVADLAIPDSIRDAVQQRLGELGDDVRAALQVAAVIGQRFDFELLQKVSGLSEAELVRALRAGIDAQLLLAETDERGEERYVFRHALTRESVLAELLQRERRLLHRAVGEAIESLGDPSANAEALAYHFDESRDAAKAYRYAELASREALRVFAATRAKQHLERALALAPDDDPAIGELQLRLASIAMFTGDVPRARRAAQDALRAFRERGDARGAGRALVQLSLSGWYLGLERATTALVEEAIGMLEPLGPSVELAEAYAELARIQMLDGLREEAIAVAEGAIAMARETGATQTLVEAQNTMGTAKARLGDPEGERLQRAALALALEHGFGGSALRAYNNLWVTTHAALDDGGRALHAEATGLMRARGMQADNFLVRDAQYALADGDWERALRAVAEAGDSVTTAWWKVCGESLVVAARRGPDDAIPILTAGTRRMIARGDVLSRHGASVAAEPYTILGRHRDVVDAVAILESDLRAHNDVPDSYAVPSVIEAILAAAWLGDATLRDRWIDLALDLAHDWPLTAAVDVARAERSLAAGDRDAAIAGLAQAKVSLRRAISVAAPLAVRLRRAELLRDRDAPGDREAASAELGEVTAFARKVDARWYLARLEAWAKERDIALV